MTAIVAKDQTASTLLTEELYRLVGRTRRILWTAAARGVEARGQSIFTWQVLCYLVRAGPTAQRDLAYFTAQDPGGVSRVLDELVDKGLVRRRHDARDRRKLLVEPTAKGRAWFRASSPEVMARVGKLFEPLTVAQRRRLRDLLSALVTDGEPK